MIAVYALIFVIVVVGVDLLLEPIDSFPDRKAYAKQKFRAELDRFRRQADRAACAMHELRAKAEQAGVAIRELGDWWFKDQIEWPADYEITGEGYSRTVTDAELGGVGGTATDDGLDRQERKERT